MTGGPAGFATVQITPDGSNGDITTDIAAAAAQTAQTTIAAQPASRP
ncbi:MAG: hypothetical protein R2932_16665 [Caldilineaceae bacterium]